MIAKRDKIGRILRKYEQFLLNCTTRRDHTVLSSPSDDPKPSPVPLQKTCRQKPYISIRNYKKKRPTTVHRIVQKFPRFRKDWFETGRKGIVHAEIHLGISRRHGRGTTWVQGWRGASWTPSVPGPAASRRIGLKMSAALHAIASALHEPRRFVFSVSREPPRCNAEGSGTYQSTVQHAIARDMPYF